MSGTNSGDPALLFGKRLIKERRARGWKTTAELARRMGVNAAHLSRIELGRRPPTEKIAQAADAVFGGDNFLELYEEMRTWAPAGFRDWPEEHEDKATSLRVWSAGIVHGHLQTQAYAETLLRTYPGVAADVVASRLANRMERQRRVLMRETPPLATYLVDHTALYRCVGSAAVMAEQMRHLLEVAAMPNVTMQVLPAREHPATQGGFIIADATAAFAETVVGGYVYTAAETLSALDRLFDTLRSECYRASESAAIIGKAEEVWTGERAASQEPTAVTASKLPLLTA
jgi:transcriptional regulator with XRE-family HTH domain